MNKELIEFIGESYTCFHAVSEIEKRLKSEGYTKFNEQDSWGIKKGSKHYVVRNQSSIIAFNVGENITDLRFNMAASHSDSPNFKVKPNALVKGAEVLKLNTEGYGGMIGSTWLDRPLTLAGRVMVKQDNKIVSKLFAKKDCLLIPSLAIHLNRGSQTKTELNLQIDLLPIVSEMDEDFTVNGFICDEVGCDKDDIVGFDLYVVNGEDGKIWGVHNEFVSSPRIDDLQCAYATLKGFVEAENNESVNIYACFDNEEVGSRTRQGADSTFLNDVLLRINNGLGFTQEDYYRTLARSFMVSCDNGHAVHPNHPGKSDETNRVFLNKGIVIKFNAAQSYTSDALSASIFKDICKTENIPTQYYTNRSDLVGGGTLGNVSASHVSVMSVDIGCPQWAMHSAYETCGSKDTEYMIKAIKAFYQSNISNEDGNVYFVK